MEDTYLDYEELINISSFISDSYKHGMYGNSYANFSRKSSTKRILKGIKKTNLQYNSFPRVSGIYIPLVSADRLLFRIHKSGELPRLQDYQLKKFYLSSILGDLGFKNIRELDVVIGKKSILNITRVISVKNESRNLNRALEEKLVKP